jgi:hypothetical protein
VLIAAAVVLIAVAGVLLATLLGKSSPGKSTAGTSARTAAAISNAAAKHSRTRAAKSRAKPPAPAISPAETSVVVLNATEAEGLAHRTASQLQQAGYSQALAQSGTPPGSGQISMVEYASRHQPEAEGVARALGITDVLPVEAGVTALAGEANVVVIVGQDRVAKSQ